MTDEAVFANARIVTGDSVVMGALVTRGGRIAAVDPGATQAAGAVDLEGDWLLPGLVELHTDNLERLFSPRPGVRWPADAAMLTHDAQVAAAGITTVCDAVCVGFHGGKSERLDYLNLSIDVLRRARAAGALKAEHLLHLRLEIADPNMLELFEPLMAEPSLRLVSLMDHTPGQRQWRNIEHLRTYSLGTGKTEAEFEEDVVVRQREGAENVGRNWSAVVEMFRSRGIPIATHDDTTVEHVEAGIASGAVISEFPTTVEAAQAAKQRGLATIAGAPNVVRGGSHSGGVSVSELAEKGLLDGLSSDYVPASLLQAVLKLHAAHGVALPEAMGMVTWKVADILGLRDRGHLKPGLRADLLRFRTLGATPVLNAVWSKGERAF